MPSDTPAPGTTPSKRRKPFVGLAAIGDGYVEARMTGLGKVTLIVQGVANPPVGEFTGIVLTISPDEAEHLALTLRAEAKEARR